MPTASGHIQNLIANHHLKRERGDFFTDGADIAAHLLVQGGTDDDHVEPAGDASQTVIGACTGSTLENEKKDHSAASYFAAETSVRVESGATRAAWLADGESVVKGGKFVAAAAGEVRAYVPIGVAAGPVLTGDDPAAILGEFSETLDNSLGGAPALIAVEWYE